jgi:hypothetical protein
MKMESYHTKTYNIQQKQYLGKSITENIYI